MLKKIFIISTTILLFVVIFLLIYNFFFKKATLSEDSQQEIPEEVIDAYNSTQQTEEKITRIAHGGSIINASIQKEDIYFFDTTDTSVYKTTIRGTAKELVKKLVAQGAHSFLLSPEKKEFLFYTSENGIFVYNSETDTMSSLGFVDYAVWADMEDKVLYKAYDTDFNERALYIADTDGSNAKKIATIPYRRVSFAQIPGSLSAVFWPEPSAFTQTKLEAVNVLTPGEPAVLRRDDYGADFSFSPDGEYILMSSTLEKGGSKTTLGIMNSDGAQYRNLSIPTLISKTVWSNDNTTVFYAQPTDIPSGSVLPNDYMAKKFTTRDTFWKVDITSGKKERIIDLSDLDEKIDATDLFLSEDETILFFTNRVNGILYRLNL